MNDIREQTPGFFFVRNETVKRRSKKKCRSAVVERSNNAMSAEKKKQNRISHNFCLNVVVKQTKENGTILSL